MKKPQFSFAPTSSLLKLFSLFFFWRAGLFFVAWIGTKYFTFEPSFPYSDIFLIPSKLPRFIWSFGNFDGVHYLSIATNGYAAQFTQVFFPVYPFLLRFIHLISPFSMVLNALFLSSLLFFLTMIMFYKLLRMDYGNNVSLWTVAFMLVFPTAFYFGSIYTESLFLFLVISSFYFARKNMWFYAITLAAISTGTRIVGLALIPALFIEWYMQYKNSSWVVDTWRKILSRRYHIYPSYADPDSIGSKLRGVDTETNRSFFSIQRKIITLGRPEILFFSIFLSLTGLALYMVYLQWYYQDSLYFWHVQGVFGAERSGSAFILFPQVIVRYFKILTTVSPQLEMYWVALIEVLMSLLAILFLVVAAVKKVRISYVIFSAIAFMMPTFTGTLSSMPRYILILFPLYIVFARVQSIRLKWFLLCLSSILLVVFTIIFTRGHWLS